MCTASRSAAAIWRPTPLATIAQKMGLTMARSTGRAAWALGTSRGYVGQRADPTDTSVPRAQLAHILPICP
eukprot:8200005-Pyramimonas_sp.AAC.1